LLSFVALLCPLPFSCCTPPLARPTATALSHGSPL
jgi:hypothetical protein